MLNRLTIACVALCALFLGSCVSSKKMKAAQQEAETAKTQVASLEKEVAQYKNQVATLTSQNNSMSQDFASYKKGFESYKKKCEDMQVEYAATREILDKEAEALLALAEKLETALADFNDKGVEVENRKGYICVSISDELLYKTGSAVPGKKATDALAPLASVLKDYPNLKVVVLGNTDDTKFKTGANDNWSLSTERANGIVRILRDKYGIDPARLTAAGKGKYNPIADNTTADGRAKNRRTDIILNPDMEKLWESVQN